MNPIPFDEVQRLASLQALDILDTPPEPAFDRITRLVSRQFDVPISLISLIDPARQWFKSKVGLDVDETPREYSFCQFAIMDNRIMQVPDATKDRRFADNPLVLGDPEIRFYAGAPLVTRNGFRLGTLCLIDTKPRDALSEAQQAQLRDFADLVIGEMELRRLRRLLGAESQGISQEVAGALNSLRHAEEELSHQAQMDVIAHVAHELRTPLSAMLGFAEIIRREFFGPIEDDRYPAYASKIENCGHHLLSVLNGMMDLARAEKGGLRLQESVIDPQSVAHQAVELSQPELDRFGATATISSDLKDPRLLADHHQLTQMLINLIGNAARHVAKGSEIAIVTAQRADGGLDISVADPGCGMTEAEVRQALAPFSRGDDSEARHPSGLGVGLPLTKRLIEMHGGVLAIDSKRGEGTRVTLRFPAYRVREPGAPASTQPINLQ